MNATNIDKKHKTKNIVKVDNSHVYMYLHIESNKSTAGHKTGLLRSPFLISTSWFFILAVAFFNDHVAAFRTVLRSATEKNELGGYEMLRFCPKWHSVEAHRIGLNSSDVTSLVATENIRNKYSFSKSPSVRIAVVNIAKLLTRPIFIYITAQVK